MCLTVVYNSEISKLQHFEDEPISEFDKEKYKRWYENYRADMSQALSRKDESASEVIQRYKQVSSSI